jgi:hypothetical protein
MARGVLGGGLRCRHRREYRCLFGPLVYYRGQRQRKGTVFFGHAKAFANALSWEVWVRSICSGVIEVLPAATAWKSVPSPASLQAPGGPIQ